MSTSLPSLYPVILRKRADFLRVQKSTQRWVTPAFVVSCTIPPADDDSAAQRPPRIGFTITKKLGNAVTRNRIRRRLRHLVPPLIHELSLTGWDIVLLARPEAATRGFDDMAKDFRWAMRKLREQQAEAAHTMSQE